MKDVSKRFIRYAMINTRSDEESLSVPSTPGQYELAKLLEQELQSMGLKTRLSDDSYLYASLDSNMDIDLPVLGLLAHLDTADFESEGICPKVTQYTGGDIVLNEEAGIVLRESEFPQLENYLGQDLIHTNGLTLLGADDKAGIAEIMTVLKYLIDHPEIKHPKLAIAFTPDEEIGRGPECFDMERFGADYAYTVDGGPLGELEYENFNACSVKVCIHGRNIHPGSAKGKMINSMTIGIDFASRFPKDEVPEKTEGYEGFYHLMKVAGTEEETVLHYIIRDHDREKFEAKKAFVEHLVETLNQEYGAGTIDIVIKDSYYNMKEKIEPVMFLIDYAKQAMRDCAVEPLITPIRGGTDGAQLSYKGLPCPNIFTGGENFHGKFEFISVQSMEKACEVLLRLIEIFGEKAYEDRN